MKKFSLTIILTAALLPVSLVFAQTNCDPKKGYCPLEPLPGLTSVQNLNFAQFLGAIFNLLITAGALLAVGTLVYAGISYILSEAFETKGEAKRRMQAALWGLVILLGAWLMLYTINPALLNFDLSVPGSTGSASQTNQTNGSSASTTRDITVGGGTGTVIYDSIPVSADQMNKYQQDCASKGQVFRQIDTGTDDIGSYTEYKCQ